VSIYVTWVAHRLGATPNAVSVLNLFVGLAACAALGLGTGGWLVLGAGLVHLFAVLDSVDGELARLTRRFTLEGLFLEDLSAYLMLIGFWLAIGAYLFRTTGALWPAAIAIGLVALLRNTMPAARRALLKSVLGGRAATPEALAALARDAAPGRLGRIRGFVEDHVLHGTNVWVALSTLAVIEELGGLTELRLVLIGFLFFAAGHAGRELVGLASYLRGGKLDRELAAIQRAATRAGRDG
jgi:phosphatidylglycerophosphate synthase